MTDKRNIVIKVSYPVAGKATENVAPTMVTEWNIKRIVMAIGVLLLILVALIYGISADTQKTDVDNDTVPVDVPENQAAPQIKVKKSEIKKLEKVRQTVAETNPLINSKKELNKKTENTPVRSVIKKQDQEKVIKERTYLKVNSNVPRALLTYAINNKEPAGDVVKAVDVSHKKPVWLYYFTELKSMKGSKVYHEWLKNGAVVSRQELVISDDTWRTSSRKLLSDSEKGNWTVRLVDKNNHLLNEKNFKVE